jgi:hypothetical protein
MTFHQWMISLPAHVRNKHSHRFGRVIPWKSIFSDLERQNYIWSRHMGQELFDGAKRFGNYSFSIKLSDYVRSLTLRRRTKCPAGRGSLREKAFYLIKHDQ